MDSTRFEKVPSTAQRKRNAVTSHGSRIVFIDIARFLAMALVFYGHFIERVMYLGNPTAAAQYKFIYAFHMPLFFILAGYVSGQHQGARGVGHFLKHRLLSRLLPFIFFTVVFMLLAAIFPGDFFQLSLPSLAGYIEGLKNTLFGIPLFCVPSWFLMIIFSVELIHHGAARWLTTDRRLISGCFLIYVAGYLFNHHVDLFNPLKGRTIGWNVLFIHEAVFMYAFYLLGLLLHRKSFLRTHRSARLPALWAVAAFCVVLFTYRLNRGQFSFHALDAVVILFSSHGHALWFLVAAVAGSLMVLFIARMLPPWRPLAWLGRNTLILMCLNGIFYHYINPPLAGWLVEHLPGTPAVVLFTGCVVTALSLVLSMPLVYLLERWLPQLTGRPRAAGPLLKPLLR